MTDCEDPVLVRFGAVTDLHYARLKACGDRYYQESGVKLRECVDTMNAREVDFLVELGDFKDQSATIEETETCLDEIEAEFRRFRGPRYHVLGNHDHDCLTKAQFLSHISNFGQESSLARYSFVQKGVTFVVLDANYNSKMEPYAPGNWTWDDAYVPPEELLWLEQTLSAAAAPVVVFVHQRIDPNAEIHHLVKNAAEVRAVLERSGKVKAVISGHEHSGGSANLNGIAYYTLRALVVGPLGEGGDWAEISLHQSGRLTYTVTARNS